MIHHLLEPYLPQLYGISSNDNTRVEVSKKIVNAIENQNEQLHSQGISHLLNKLAENGMDMIEGKYSGKYPGDKSTLHLSIAGLTILDCLLDITETDYFLRRKLADFFKKLLFSSSNSPCLDERTSNVIRHTASCIGHLARISTASESDYLKSSFLSMAFRCIIEPRSDVHRYSGVLILTQLAIHIPVHVYDQKQKLFDGIFDAISDRNAIIRVGASEAFSEALKVVSERESSEEYVGQAIRQYYIGIDSNKNEKIIGSMMILDTLISDDVSRATLYSACSASLDDVIWSSLKQADSMDFEIRQMVIYTIPKLATAFSSYFKTHNERYLSYSIKYLLNCTKIEKSRQAAYISLGRLFEALFEIRLKYVNEVMEAICSGLSVPFCKEALQCLEMVLNFSVTSRSLLTLNMLDIMFSGGLSIELIGCLKVCMHTVPCLKDHIRQKLSFCINNKLQKNAFRRDTTNRTDAQKVPYRNTSVFGLKNWFNSSLSSHTSHVSLDSRQFNEIEVILALQVLAYDDFFPKFFSEDFTTSARYASLRTLHAINYYYDHDKASIRKSAVMTSVSVLDKVIDIVEPMSEEFSIITRTTDRLLILGVGDEDVGVRVCVFDSLKAVPSLDTILSKTKNTNLIVEALNDEIIHIKIAAMSILSRLCHHDSVHLMPFIRLALSKLMRLIKRSPDLQLRQESVELVQAIVVNATTQMIPYVPLIFESLMDLLNDSQLQIEARGHLLSNISLSTLGELAIVSPESIQSLNLQNEVFSQILKGLEDDSSPNKQEISVIALGKIVRSLGLVSEPYNEYPSLFELLINVIQRKDIDSPQLRLQAIKTAGLLGVVQQDQFERFLLHNVDQLDKEHEVEGVPDILTENEVFIEEERLDKYCLSVVTKNLMKILRDDTLSQHHLSTTIIAVRIIRILGNQSISSAISASEDSGIVSGILFRLNKAEHGSTLQEALLEQITIVVHVLGRHLSNDVEKIAKVCCDYFETHTPLKLNLIESLLLIVTESDADKVLDVVIPCFVKTLKKEVSSAVEELSQKQPFLVNCEERQMLLKKASCILLVLANVSSKLGTFKFQVLQPIIEIMTRVDVHIKSRSDSLKTLVHIALNSYDFSDCACAFLHPLIRILDDDEITVQCLALTALAMMAVRLGLRFLPFILPIRRKCLNLGKDTLIVSKVVEYESIISTLLRIKSERNSVVRLSSPSTIDFQDLTGFQKRSKQCKLLMEPIVVDTKALETAWKLSDKPAASDLIQWVNRLSMELLRQSPSPVIRQCASLAKNFKPLANELFNISFSSTWEELSYVMARSEVCDVIGSIPLVRSMELAFRSPQIPNKICSILLHVAEFMEILDKPLPLDTQLLARAAAAVDSFSRCLYYREIEFNSKNVSPSSECIESLITVNNKLGNLDAAAGILEYVKRRYSQVIVQPLWLEKLSRWDEAKNSYLTRNNTYNEKYPKDRPPQHKMWMLNQLGTLRCLHALGEYSELVKGAEILLNDLQSVEIHGKEDYYTWLNEIQKLGANAAWMLGSWENMEYFARFDRFRVDSIDASLEQSGSFYETILAINQRDYIKGSNTINSIRESLADNMSTLLVENYSRANRAMISMQVLAELEEVIEFKKFEDHAEHSRRDIYSAWALIDDDDDRDNNDEDYNSAKTILEVASIGVKRKHLLKTWQTRLRCVPCVADIYRQILAVHTMVIDPKDDLESWLKLASLCREEGRMKLCQNILLRLNGPRLVNGVEKCHIEFQGEERCDISVFYNFIKYVWHYGERRLALETMLKFVHEDLELATATPSTETGIVELKVKSLLKCAEWMRSLREYPLEEVKSIVNDAKCLKENYYWVWHAWGATNYEWIQRNGENASMHSIENNVRKNSYKKHAVYDILLQDKNGQIKHSSNMNSSSEANMINFVSGAIEGFINSIRLGKHQPIAYVLQDILRLLTLWFNYGMKQRQKTEIYKKLEICLDSVSVKYWLYVIPQLIARINDTRFSELLLQVLLKVSTMNPQALVCPISVAVNTNDKEQKRIAKLILEDMRIKDTKLVGDAQILSSELMRIAITPQELWHDGLENAARMYKEKDVDSMIHKLLELHASMDEASSIDLLRQKDDGFSEKVGRIGLSTLRDISFRHSYGRDLAEARQWINAFHNTKNLLFVHQAWDLYHKIHTRLSTQLKSLKKIEMSHICALTAMENLRLAVPGSASNIEGDGEVIRIQRFVHSIDVINSKQRPRKLTMIGSDGRRYQFLLKGKEDLRQDERVMQLFFLINICMNNYRSSNGTTNLAISRYSVLPLSSNSGLIGWVKNCDTILQLVLTYRKVKSIAVNVEEELIIHSLSNTHYAATYTDFDKLSVMAKIEVFYQIMHQTKGNDVAKMLWLKSKTSDVWVERRANFTKSIAMMSIVGYILGLGDRHLANLLLDRISGKVVHIDFGDCFESTQIRSKFPEKVPFRLTRMLTSAMEVSGIEGTFRSTSEIVMGVLHDNRDSVQAMLEAFQYDPLVSWKGKGVKLMVDTIEPTIPIPLLTVRESIVLDDLSILSKPQYSEYSLPEDVRSSENMDTDEMDEEGYATIQEHSNEIASKKLLRIQAKLTGREFAVSEESDDLTIEQQVGKLIEQATLVENLCQLYVGWRPFW